MLFLNDTDINIWKYLSKTDKPVILYGMGNGADKILHNFDKFNIKCSGIMASDNFVRGQSYCGFKVSKLSFFEELFDDFIIAVAFGTQLPDVMENIKSISLRHEIVVPNVPVFGSGIFDDNFISQNAEKMECAYSLLADSRSRQVFEAAVKFYYSGKLELLWDITDSKDEIFQNVLKLSPHENYIDLGAYHGDTIDELIHYSGGYNKIIAVEPDFKNFRKLNEYIKGMDNIIAENKIIWNHNGTILFSQESGRSSGVNLKGTPSQAVTIDKLNVHFNASYIKMDVEGCEKEAIAGGVLTLESSKPKLNIAAYHRFADFFELILLIHSINPNYRFFLRHHPYIPFWDTNIYCI